MTGIGFLGGGVIIKEGFTIRGLSTAASIWTTAFIGIIIGVGFYRAAISATALSMVAMTVMVGLRSGCRIKRRCGCRFPSSLQHREPSAEDIRARMRALGIMRTRLVLQLLRSEGAISISSWYCRRSVQRRSIIWRGTSCNPPIYRNFDLFRREGDEGACSWKPTA